MGEKKIHAPKTKNKNQREQNEDRENMNRFITDVS